MKLDEYLKKYISGIYEWKLDVYPSEKNINKILKIIKENSNYPDCKNEDIYIGVHNWFESIKPDGGNPIDFNKADKYFLLEFKTPKKKEVVENRLRGDIRAEHSRLCRYPLTKAEENEILEIIKTNLDYPKYSIDDVVIAIQDWSEEINKLIGHKEK